MVDRNSTSFLAHNAEFLKKKLATSRDELSFLKYHQEIVRTHVQHATSRGLLINHAMGLGKSILAIAIAIDILEQTTNDVIMLMPKSLVPNMKESIEKYTNMRRVKQPNFPDYTSRFSFVSLNAGNMLTQVSRAVNVLTHDETEIPLLDNKTLLIDEAHNLFRQITNGSKNGIGLYEAINMAKNVKIYAFTGTPISNDPFELSVCFNLIGGKGTLPEDYFEFKKYFCHEDGSLKNKNKFQNRVQGLCSVVNHKSKTIKTDIEFPEEKPIITEHCNMTGIQYAHYKLARDKEAEEGSGSGGFFGKTFVVTAPAPLTKPGGKVGSTYHVRSRQLGNNDPDATESPKFKKILSNLGDGLGLVYSQFTSDGGLGAFAKFLINNGWIAFNLETGVEPVTDEPSQEIPVSRVDKHIAKLSKTTWWKTGVSGGSVSAERTGGATNQDPPKVFAMLTGAVPLDTRTAIIAMMTAKDNIEGAKCRLLLVSATGAEGIDLVGLRHIHIMEPYWNWGRHAQIIARGVRTNSHLLLPPEKKNVQPYIYIAVPPEEEKIGDEYPPTTDSILYHDALQNAASIKSYLDALSEVSIECILAGEDYCRMCTPDDQPIFTSNLIRDINSIDPCTSMREHKVKPKTVIVDGTEYKYEPYDRSLFGIRVFFLDTKLNVYRNMDESDERFMSVYEATL